MNGPEKCQACGTPFTFPEGQYAWRCANDACRMTNTRELTKQEIARNDCLVCGGDGGLPVISVERVPGHAISEPTLRWRYGCPGCEKGRVVLSKLGKKDLPEVDHLPHYGEWKDSGLKRYYHFIVDKWDRMRMPVTDGVAKRIACKLRKFREKAVAVATPLTEEEIVSRIMATVEETEGQ